LRGIARGAARAAGLLSNGESRTLRAAAAARGGNCVVPVLLFTGEGRTCGRLALGS
jgi:hypothetical protein